MIDPKVANELVLVRELLEIDDVEDSVTRSPTQLVQDLIVCHGTAELALSAICVELDCVPDKKDIRLVDYVDSLKKTAVPGTFNVKGDPSSRPMPDALLPETGFFVELQQARTESQTRFHLPHPHRWLHAKQQTLEHIAKLCRQVLGIDLSQLAPSAALLAPLHDGFVQPLPQPHRHLVHLMRPINLDCLPRSAQRDFAVFATAQVLLQIGTHLGRNRIVD